MTFCCCKFSGLFWISKHFTKKMYNYMSFCFRGRKWPNIAGPCRCSACCAELVRPQFCTFDSAANRRAFLYMAIFRPLRYGRKENTPLFDL